MTEYILIEEFTTPVIDSGNGEKNRWEGYITQGLPYPDFINDEGKEGWFYKPAYDLQKTYLTLVWVDEENGITNENRVMELTGLGGDSPETRSWPLMLKGYHHD